MRIRTLALASIAGALLLPAAASAQTVPTYSVEKLITATTILDGDWVAASMNDQAMCVGSRTLNGVTLAWVMSPPAPPVFLPLPPGYANSHALDVNASGVIVGNVAQGNLTRGAVWTPTPAGYQVAVLPTLPGHSQSNAVAINDGGDIVGTSQAIPVWFNSPTGVRDLGALGFSFDPVDINNQRQICGGNLRMNLDTSVVENLGQPPLDRVTGTFAVGINAQGQVAANAGVRLSSSSFTYFAVRYTDDIGWQVLGGGQPPFSSGNGAYKINDRGDVFALIGNVRGVFFDAFGFVSVQTHLEPDAMYWLILQYFSVAMNNRGQLFQWATNDATDAGGYILVTPIGTTILPGDINADGHVRPDDACAWQSAPVDLNGDGLINSDDRALLFGLIAAWGTPVGDCNANGIADSCDIAAGTSSDININGIPDECEPDCNADGVPDTAEPDWNANGTPDPCDIASGTSRDCNHNGIPDESDRQALSRTYTATYGTPPVIIYPLRTLSRSIFVRDIGPVADVNFRLHDWYRVGDMVVRLTHNGITITLIDRPGFPNIYNIGFRELGYDITLDDEGTGGFIENIGTLGGNFDPIVSPPSYRPNDPLSAFDGQDMHGIWTLDIETVSEPPPRAELLSWGLVIGKAAIPVADCCPADFNADGTLNSQDFFDFLAAFFALQPAADFNADGTINSQDFFDFLAAFFAGC